MKLYHGTSSANLDSILKSGIRPRGRKKGNWNATVRSNPRAVYLTNAYALYFANAAMGTGSPVALEIDIEKLDKSYLAPDEDFMEQASRFDKSFGFLKSKSMAERTKYFRSRCLSQYQHMWRLSLESLGTCCYYNCIKPEAITRYAILEPKTQIQHLSDPTITIINYKIMGKFYRDLTRKIFDDPILEADDNFDWCYKNLERVSRDGINVINVGNP